MMGLFIVSELLLMTLLLQPTVENEQKTQTSESDNSVRYGEFCLRISDDSHRTSSEPVTQLPTKSAHPAGHTTQQLEQPTTEPTRPDSQTTQLLEQTTQPDYIYEPDNVEINVHPVQRMAPRISSAIKGCRCEEREKIFPNETLQFRSMMTWFPSETCNSTEFIASLKDGREVCVITPSLLAFANELLRPSRKIVPEAAAFISHGEPLVTSPAPLDPTTELPKTTQPPVTETTHFNDPNSPNTLAEEEKQENKVTSHMDGSLCNSCNSMTNLDNVDPKTVQSLNVKMQSFPCPAHIYVSLKDGKDFCWDSNWPELKAMLEKLEVPPTNEDIFDQTPKNITNGCRCQKTEQKLPNETSPVTSTRIWPPSVTCNSTEFIETLKDGREVCMTAVNLSAYLELFFPEMDYILVTEPSIEIKYLIETRGRRKDDTNRFTFEGLRGDGGISHLSGNKFSIVERIHCTPCIPFENWDNIDPKDVQSVQMEMPPHPDCPVIIYISMKTKFFCVDLTQPGILPLLEKLDTQAH